MTDRVIAGTYADFKLIKTRKVMQMVIEIPLERAEEVVAKFGLPQPHEELWLAIAALKSESVTENARASKAIQMAGILCKDQNFGQFLNIHKNMSDVIPTDHMTVENAVRAITGVRSRAEWRDNEQSLRAWERLLEEYRSVSP